MQYYMASIFGEEAKVLAITEAQYEYELRVIDRGLNEIVRGWQDYRLLTRESNDDIEAARRHLLVKSFKSVRMAVHTLKVGHYSEAITLVRTSFECLLLADHVDKPNKDGIYPIVRALFYDEGKIGKGPLSMTKLAANAGIKWGNRYGDLSEFAHPRETSLRSLHTLDSDKHLTIQLEGTYDKDSASAVIYEILWEIEGMFVIVEALTAPWGSDWNHTAFPRLQDIQNLMLQLESKM